MLVALGMLIIGIAIGSFPYEKLFTGYWIDKIKEWDIDRKNK